jgi:hypothetical protein
MEGIILKKTAVISLLGLFLLSGCSESTPSATPIPPTEIVIPTEVSTPDRPIFACDQTKVVKELRQVLPVEDMVLTHNNFNDGYYLTAWFVDLEMDPQASSADIQSLTELAVRHSAEVARALVLLDPCILSTFNSLTVIVVDELYNAWYLGSVSSTDLNLKEGFSEADWIELESKFDAGYRRTEKTVDDSIPAAEGACTWDEARESLESQFAKARVNVSFYFYRQGQSGEVWAQWDIPPVAQSAQEINDGFFDPLPHIDTAVSCLHPPFDTLWMVYVHQDGRAQWIFAVDGDAVRDEDYAVMLENLEPIYSGPSQ